MLKRGWIVAGGLLLVACQQAAPTTEAEGNVAAAAPQQLASADGEESNANPAESSTPGTGLCAADEPVLFSCQVRTGKTVSVCGAAGADGQRFAQYRYGRTGITPELTFPASPAEGEVAFATVPYSGGGEGQLMFTRGGVQYVVYSRTIRTRFDGEGNDPVNEDGVAVMRGEELVSRLACTDRDPKSVDYDLSDQLAGDAPDVVMLPE
jgi:hypothetical protein